MRKFHMNRRVVEILKWIALASCVMCIVYLIFVGGLVTYLLVNGVKFSSLNGFKLMINATIGVVMFTAIVNVAYIIAKREIESSRS